VIDKEKKTKETDTQNVRRSGSQREEYKNIHLWRDSHTRTHPEGEKKQ
jgi:hypothetical protein